MAKVHHTTARGVETRTGKVVAPGGQTGIGFAILNGELIISITMDGEGYIAALAGDNIDVAAHFFAEKIEELNRHDAPTLRVMQ